MEANYEACHSEDCDFDKCDGHARSHSSTKASSRRKWTGWPTQWAQNQSRHEGQIKPDQKGRLLEIGEITRYEMAPLQTRNGLSIGRVVRSTFFAANENPMHLALIGMQQDRFTMAAGVIDRMIARYERRRRFENVTDSRCRNNFEATRRHICSELQAGALPTLQPPTAWAQFLCW